MPGTPPPLWRGYDDTEEDDLLALLDEHDSKANARHEALKQEQDPDNYRPRLHERASAIAGGWRPR